MIRKDTIVNLKAKYLINPFLLKDLFRLLRQQVSLLNIKMIFISILSNYALNLYSYINCPLIQSTTTLSIHAMAMISKNLHKQAISQLKNFSILFLKIAITIISITQFTTILESKFCFRTQLIMLAVVLGKIHLSFIIYLIFYY